jgi:hypothetical protein
MLSKLDRHRWGLWELRTAWLDCRYGGYIGRRVDDGSTSYLRDCPYRVIESAMSGVDVTPDDVLVDIGCGLGRVFNWWLSRGWKNRMIGIERDAEIAARTRRRLQGYPNIEILTGDAVDLMPANGTVFFLANPFGEAVVEHLHDAILARTDALQLSVVYINCQHLDVFRKSGCWSIRILPRHPADFNEVAVTELRRP